MPSALSTVVTTLAGVALLLVACVGEAETEEQPEVDTPSEIEQVTERVVNEVVGDSQSDSAVIVFTLDEPLQLGVDAPCAVSGLL